MATTTSTATPIPLTIRVRARSDHGATATMVPAMIPPHAAQVRARTAKSVAIAAFAQLSTPSPHHCSSPNNEQTPTTSAAQLVDQTKWIDRDPGFSSVGSASMCDDTTHIRETVSG